MDDIQDAIEDVQYLSATVSSGLSPVIKWPIPTEEELSTWKKRQVELDKDAFTPEWFMERCIGFFLFAQYLCNEKQDHVRINFLQETAKYKILRPTKRRSHTILLVNKYLFKTDDKPERIEIDDYNIKLKIHSTVKGKIDSLYKEFFDETYSESNVGLTGDVVDAVRKLATRKSFEKEGNEKRATNQSLFNSSTLGLYFVDLLFDEAEAVVFESLKREYWDSFTQSSEYQRALNFFWDQDKTIGEDDFFMMRVLGRGGFGLVTGKLYCATFNSCI